MRSSQTMPQDLRSYADRDTQRRSPQIGRVKTSVAAWGITLLLSMMASSVLAQQSDSAGPETIEAAAPEPSEASGESDQAAGIDLGETAAVDASQDAPIDAEDGLDLESLMEKPEVKQMLADFDDTKSELVEAMGDLRATQIRYSNDVDRSTEATELYAKQRDRARQLLREMFRLCNQKMLLGDKEAGNFAMTMVQNHVGNSIYDEDTFEASAKLLDANMTSRFLFQAALRSSVVTGEFQTARALADIMKDDEELDACDYGIMGSLDQLEEMFNFEKERREADAKANLPRVRFHTTNGDVVVELYLNEAPSAVSNFLALIEEGFYDDAEFFQVIDNLIALCGHPTNTRTSRFLVDEIDPETARKGWAGTLMMANLPLTEGKFIPNSSSTQFSILLLPLPLTSEQQTVFGRVIEGMDVVSTFRRVDPSKKKDKKMIVLPPDRIISAEIIRAPENLPAPIYVDQPGAKMPTEPAANGE